MKKRSLLQVIKFMTVLGCMGIVLFTQSMEVYAGGINGEESRVIGAASGTFYYNNEAYRAKSEYIGQLSGRLAGEDVDLTASQANEAIRQMYASVAQGVSDGYLYKVEKNTEASTEENRTTEETPEDENSSEQDAALEEDRTEVAAVPPKTVTESTEDAEEVTQEKKTTEAPLPEVEQISEQDAAGSIRYDMGKGGLVYEKKGEDRKIALPTADVAWNVAPYVEKLRVVLVSLIGMQGVLLVALIWGKCFPWQKRKRNRKATRYYVDHKKRKMLRRLAGNFCSINMVILFIATILCIGISSTLISRGFVLDQMTSSGYFRYMYEQFGVNCKEQLQGYNGEAAETLVKEIGYDTFLSIAKSRMKDGWAGGKAEYDYSPLITELEGVTVDLSKEDKTQVINIIIGTLTAQSEDMIGTTVCGIRKGFRNMVGQLLPWYILSLLLSLSVVITMDRYRHRGARYIAASVMGASFIVMLATGICYITKLYTAYHLEPEGLYLFFSEYVKHSLIIVFAISSIGVLVGIGIGLLARLLRRIQIERES